MERDGSIFPGTCMAATLILFAACLACAGGGAVEKPAGNTPDVYHDVLVRDGRCMAAGPATVTRAEALSDVDILERIVERGHAGREALTRAGVDWLALFGGLRRDVAAMAEPIPVGELHRMLLRGCAVARDPMLSLWRTEPDGRQVWQSCGSHLDAWTSDVLFHRSGRTFLVTSSPVASVVSGAQLMGCAGRQLDEIVQRTLDPEKLRPAWRIVVLDGQAPAALSCRFNTPSGPLDVDVPLHRLRVRPTRVGPDAPAVERHSLDIARVRVHRMDRRADAELAQLVVAGPQLRGEESVLIDVRGNDGGDDRRVMELFQALGSAPLVGNSAQQLQSELTLQGRINALRCELRSGRFDPRMGGEMNKELKTLDAALAAWSRRRPGGYLTHKDSPATSIESSARPGAAPLVLLVDKECAGGCETFALLTRQTQGALIVGENTAGASSFTTALPYRLPRSGIGVAVPSVFLDHPDERLRNTPGRGHLPDVWLDVEEPEPLARSIAVCLASATCAARMTAW